MRVLLIASDYPPPFVGGSVVYVHSLLVGFPEAAEVLAGRLSPGQLEPTPPIHRVRRSRWLVPSRAPTSLHLAAMYIYLPFCLLARRLRTRDDFVLLSLGVIGNALLIPVCRLIGSRAVVFAYAEELTMPLKGAGPKNALKRLMLKTLYPYAEGFVAVSAFTRSVLQSVGVAASRVKIIWPPINAGKIRVAAPNREPGRRILSVGRLVRRKGFDHLIRAVGRLRQEFPDIRLWVAGDGAERRELENLVQGLGLSAHVEFKGEVSDEELSSLYRDCDLFALANVALSNGDCEGSPTVLIEASAYSKPVIAGDGTGADAMVEHGRTGFLVDAVDGEVLTARLGELLRNPEMGERMGRAGRLKAEVQHTATRAGGRLHDFLCALVGQDSASGGLPMRRVAGNTALYTMGHMLPPLLNLLLLPVFTRYLTPAEYGIFGYTTALCSFLSVLGHLSIHSYVLSHYHQCRDEAERRALIGTISTFIALYNSALLAVCLTVGPRLMRGSQVPFDPYIKLALWVMSLEILNAVPLAWFRIREEAGRFVFLTLGQALLSIALSLYLVAGLGMGLAGRYWGQLAADVLCLGFTLALLGSALRPRLDGVLLKRALVFCLPMAVASALDFLMTMSDRLFLERWVGLEEMGLYTVGFSIGFGLNALTQGLYKALEPSVFRMAADSVIDREISGVKSTMVALMSVIGGLMIAFSRESLELLAPARYSASYPIMAMTVARVAIQGITIPIATYLVASGLTRLQPAVCLTGALASICLNAALVPKMGIHGAAVAGIGSALATLGAYGVLVGARSSVDWRYWRDLAKLGAALAIGAAFLLLPFSLSARLAIKGSAAALALGWLVAASQRRTCA